MDKKLSVGGIIGAVVTAIAILLSQKFVNSAEDTIAKGRNADLVSDIEAVLVARDKVVINGETLTSAEALSKIATEQEVLKRQMQALID